MQVQPILTLTTTLRIATGSATLVSSTVAWVPNVLLRRASTASGSCLTSLRGTCGPVNGLKQPRPQRNERAALTYGGIEHAFFRFFVHTLLPTSMACTCCSIFLLLCIFSTSTLLIDMSRVSEHNVCRPVRFQRLFIHSIDIIIDDQIIITQHSALQALIARSIYCTPHTPFHSRINPVAQRTTSTNGFLDQPYRTIPSSRKSTTYVPTFLSLPFLPFHLPSHCPEEQQINKRRSLRTDGIRRLITRSVRRKRKSIS